MVLAYSRPHLIPPATDLSERLSRRRAQLGLTKAEAAKKVGVSARTYERWETGRAVPRTKSRILISEGLGIPVADLGSVDGTRHRGGLSDELDPYVDHFEVDRFNRMGELLKAQRPAPPRGLLASVAAGPKGEVPPRLRLQVGLALLSGLLLLGLAALGASGSGPLGG